MKIYGNRNTLWIEITDKETGENIKIECKGEMLDGGFWIYKSEEIKKTNHYRLLSSCLSLSKSCELLCTSLLVFKSDVDIN